MVEFFLGRIDSKGENPTINSTNFDSPRQQTPHSNKIGGCCGGGALLRMGDHRLPKRIMSGELENAEKRGPGGEEKEWTDCVADDLRLFGITGDWSTAALDPGIWYSAVHEGGCIGLWPRG